MKRNLFLFILALSVVCGMPCVSASAQVKSSFTSPDLKFFRLQGHVKQVNETFHSTSDNGLSPFYHVSEVRFTQNGMMRIKSPKEHQVKRNKAGQIIEWVDVITYGGDEDYTSESYKYNRNGYVTTVYSSDPVQDYETYYTLNEKGWIVSEKTVTLYGGESITETSSFSYSDIDAKGNWRKCIIVVKGRDWEKQSYTHKYTITRKITYWE